MAAMAVLAGLFMPLAAFGGRTLDTGCVEPLLKMLRKPEYRLANTSRLVELAGITLEHAARLRAFARRSLRPYCTSTIGQFTVAASATRMLAPLAEARSDTESNSALSYIFTHQSGE